MQLTIMAGTIPVNMQINKTYPKSLLKDTECISSAFPLGCNLVRFLQHLLKQVLSGLIIKCKMVNI